ncbi:MAG: AAA family ATPase [Chloroherpetonaceae bacterium]|nr:AAA family ATPase [Chloroherpetonaceae bacterium]
MQLDRIDIKGFKSINSLSLHLKPINILIGANGAGKSNFISVFKLLNELIKENLQKYIQVEGGANSLAHFGVKVTHKIELTLGFGINTYHLSLLPTQNDILLIDIERCTIHDKTKYTEPYHQYTTADRYETNLTRDSSGVAQFVRKCFQEWRVYHFHDTSSNSAVKRTTDINDNLHLRPDGGNLAAFLYRLKVAEYDSYRNIRDTIRLIVPYFDDFLLRANPVNPNTIKLEWYSKGSDYPFQVYHLSDGTLRFICLATLFLQPAHLMPSTILIDEPELGLHPYAINLLASFIKSVSSIKQVIISTQSVSLINHFSAEDIIVVNQKNRVSSFERLSEERLSNWLEEYSLGELWEKNVFGGRPE